MFKFYYQLKIWKIKNDIKFYEKITGQFNTQKQKELDYYLCKLNSIKH